MTATPATGRPAGRAPTTTDDPGFPFIDALHRVQGQVERGLLDQDPLQLVILGGADPPGVADAKIRLEAAAPVTHQPVELPGARYRVIKVRADQADSGNRYQWARTPTASPILLTLC